MLLNVLMDYAKIKNILKLGKSNPMIHYSRILFNLIINPNKVFKTLFIEDQGIYILKKILKTSFT